MQSARGNAIYTAFATLVFTGLQYFQGERDAVVLLVSGAMFFLFTFFMLRLISRVMLVITQGLGKRRQDREEASRGPAEVTPTTTRPEHVRRRRERRRRR